MNEKLIFERYFNGEVNPITPRILSYVSRQFDDEILLFERSKGTGLYDRPLYGATALVFNPKTNEVGRIGLSKAFGSLRELDNYIKGITETDFNNAGRYGEIKVIQ